MSSEHAHYIEGLAQKALDSVSCDAPPVELEKIAEKFHLQIVHFDFAPAISAVLKPDKMVIGVNQNHPPLRKRFSIAHELGHFLLGHDEKDFIDDKFDRPTPIEREANQFASFLLMPKSWVTKSVKEKGLELERLAREFKVSEQAMTIRLLELNLIK